MEDLKEHSPENKEDKGVDHGSRYCQLIRHANKEKRVQWARADLHESFKDSV